VSFSLSELARSPSRAEEVIQDVVSHIGKLDKVDPETWKRLHKLANGDNVEGVEKKDVAAVAVGLFEQLMAVFVHGTEALLSANDKRFDAFLASCRRTVRVAKVAPVEVSVVMKEVLDVFPDDGGVVAHTHRHKRHLMALIEGQVEDARSEATTTQLVQAVQAGQAEPHRSQGGAPGNLAGSSAQTFRGGGKGPRGGRGGASAGARGGAGGGRGLGGGQLGNN